MIYWVRLLALVGAVILFIAAIGSLLPRGYDFSTDIKIDAAPDEVFSELNRLSNWQSWSQWNPAEIPGLKVQYSGNETGVGAIQTWTDVRGEGKLWITESMPDQSIKYDMVFANFPKMTSKIELVGSDRADAERTTVSWSSQGRLPGGPFYGFFSGIFSAQMKNQYQLSLEKLKKKIESNQKPEKTP